VLYELSFRRSLPDGVTKTHALPPYGSATSHDGHTLYFGEPSKHRIQAIDVDTGAPGGLAGRSSTNHTLLAACSAADGEAKPLRRSMH
jgi:hypothetical protein